MSAEPAKKVLPLRLPDLGDAGHPGARFVKRAVSVMFGSLLLLIGSGLLITFLVRMDVTVKGNGTLEPVRIWPVRAQSAGPIRDVLVRTGDTVSQGQPMLRLDELTLQAQLDGLEAQYRSARIDRDRAVASAPLERQQQVQKLDRARSRLTTTRATLLQRMVEHGVGTNVDSLLAAYRPGQHVMLDQAVGEVRSAEADIRLSGAEADMLTLKSFDREKSAAEMQRLEVQIREARERLNRAAIVSPIHGVVLTEQIERLAGSYTREGEQLLEVADLAEWRVTMMVPERQIHKIKVGDLVKVEVQAFDQKDRDHLRGRVIHVASDPGGGSPGAGAGAGAGGGGAGGGMPGGGAPGGAAGGGGGSYRVVAALDRGQLDRAGLQKFRRGYSVKVYVVTRSGRIIDLLLNRVREKLNR
ncbi:MAG TPA: efflux RND transporter periplasmic adaptor subunit [Longimicrobium sp.]|nr:efflux RND transporter periplasmic adaptor subunit [Longimicrobium sp.]